jgi:hypothetical protein
MTISESCKLVESAFTTGLATNPRHKTTPAAIARFLKLASFISST